MITKSKATVYDELRAVFPLIVPPDMAVITPGVKQLIRIGGADAPMEVLDSTELGSIIRNFNDFPEDDDPYGERDFGAFQFKGENLFWKIDDYAGRDGRRYVLTILLAEEY